MSSAWTNHLTDQKSREDFAVIVRNSTLLLTRLQQIIEDHERQLNTASITEKDFEDPNWSHKQAFRLGGLSQLKKLKEILP